MFMVDGRDVDVDVTIYMCEPCGHEYGGYAEEHQCIEGSDSIWFTRTLIRMFESMKEASGWGLTAENMFQTLVLIRTGGGATRHQHRLPVGCKRQGHQAMMHGTMGSNQASDLVYKLL